MKYIYGTKSYSYLIVGVSVKTQTGQFFQVLIHFHPLHTILGCKQQRKASVHFSGHWQQDYSIILWFSLMQGCVLVF